MNAAHKRKRPPLGSRSPWTQMRRLSGVQFSFSLADGAVALNPARPDLRRAGPWCQAPGPRKSVSSPHGERHRCSPAFCRELHRLLPMPARSIQQPRRHKGSRLQSESAFSSRNPPMTAQPSRLLPIWISHCERRHKVTQGRSPQRPSSSARDTISSWTIKGLGST